MTREALRAAIAAVATQHVRGDWTEEGWRSADDGFECVTDGDPWPCTAERLRAVAAALAGSGPEARLDEACRDAVADATSRLIIAFRRFCIAEFEAAPLDEDFRVMLATAAALAATPTASPTAGGHRAEFTEEDVPTGFCECGKAYGHPR